VVCASTYVCASTCTRLHTFFLSCVLFTFFLSGIRVEHLRISTICSCILDSYSYDEVERTCHLSFQVDRSYALDAGDVAGDEPYRNTLMQQNLELRRRLEDEHAQYKRKLAQYQEGQQRQAQLVQKLQQKVMQYKKRCSEIETKLSAREEPLVRASPRVNSSARNCIHTYVCM
jgi:hypothetical protein